MSDDQISDEIRMKKQKALSRREIEETVARDRYDRLLNFSADILDKQYRNYNEIDTKMQTLLTINSILLAGGILVVKDLSGIQWWEFLLAFLGISFMFLSLIVGLFHALPDVSSGVARHIAQPNPRTMMGISSFNTPEEYWSHLEHTNLQAMVRYNAIQIFGLSRNSRSRVKRLNRAGWLTLVGAIFLATSFASWGIRLVTANIYSHGISIEESAWASN